jgi:U3 small nucleolar RNA-associated protein 14
LFSTRKDTKIIPKMAEKITPRQKDYSKWYLDIIKAADLAEDAVEELKEAKGKAKNFFQRLFGK